MTELSASEPDAAKQTGEYEVVLVTYYSRDHLEGLLATVPEDQRFVVVDNASGADGVPAVVDRYPNARWLDGGNVGFAKAANLGARTSTADFLVFGNPDSRPTPAVWAEIVDELRSRPDLGSVGAATGSEDGHIELGVGGWEPTIRRSLIHAVGLHRLFPMAGVYAKPRFGQQVDLEWISGACLAVRREVFVSLGGFDERYFVYNEDMALGRRLRRAGLGQLLRTDLVVPHATASSGGGGLKMPQQRGSSMAQYLHDHHGPLAAVVMRAAFAVGMSPRTVVAALRGRPRLARMHLAYVQGIVTRRSPYRP